MLIHVKTLTLKIKKHYLLVISRYFNSRLILNVTLFPHVEFETKICLTNKQVSVCDARLLSLLSRTLLQQLQRLQAMVAGKVSRSCKAASTQTGTCLMVSGVKVGNCKGMRNSFHSSKAQLLFSKASQW